MLTFEGQSTRYKKCLKCGHQRTAQDQGPDWACPSCGAVYAKVEAAMAAKAALEAEDDRRDAERLARASRSPRRADPTVYGDGDDRKLWANIGYLLLAAPILGSFFAAFFVREHSSHAAWPLPTMVLGVVLAHIMARPGDDEWLNSHFRYQIRAFWRMMAWSIGLTLVAVFIIFLGLRSTRNLPHNSAFESIGSVGVALAVAFLMIGLLYVIRVFRGWIRLNRGVGMDI